MPRSLVLAYFALVVVAAAGHADPALGQLAVVAGLWQLGLAGLAAAALLIAWALWTGLVAVWPALAITGLVGWICFGILDEVTCSTD